jgi:hypothetical protein
MIRQSANLVTGLLLCAAWMPAQSTRPIRVVECPEFR